MSIGAQSISEAAISEQLQSGPTLIPGLVMKEVTQKWPEESSPQVFTARQVSP